MLLSTKFKCSAHILYILFLSYILYILYILYCLMDSSVNTCIARARALVTDQYGQPTLHYSAFTHPLLPASPNIVKAKKLRREPCPAKQPTFNELGNLTLDQPNFHTVGHPSSYSDHLLHHPSVFPFQRQSSESSILLHTCTDGV